MCLYLLVYIVISGVVLHVFHGGPEHGTIHFGKLPIPDEPYTLPNLGINIGIPLGAYILRKGPLILLEGLENTLPHILIEALDHIGHVITVVVLVVLLEHALDLFYGGGVVAVVLLAALVADEDRHSALLLVAKEVGALVVPLAQVRGLQGGGRCDRG